MTIRVSPHGALIAIEGIDGAGKTTQSERLAAALTSAGFDVVRTKEPTDGPFGRRLRESATTGRLSPEEELSTFIADRKEHVSTLLTPALDAGKIVLVDRYYFSSAAYQGVRGLDPERILALNEAFAPPPDLLVLMVLPASLGVSRVGARGGQNLFEREDDLSRAAAIFDSIQRPYLRRVDATQTPEAITREILAALADGALRAHRDALEAHR